MARGGGFCTPASGVRTSAFKDPLGPSPCNEYIATAHAASSFNGSDEEGSGSLSASGLPASEPRTRTTLTVPRELGTMICSRPRVPPPPSRVYRLRGAARADFSDRPPPTVLHPRWHPLVSHRRALGLGRFRKVPPHPHIGDVFYDLSPRRCRCARPRPTATIDRA